MEYTWLIVLSIAGMLLNGIPCEAHRNCSSFEMLKRFPHHVTVSRNVYGGKLNCSASVIAEQWVLTGLRCVDVVEFQVHFYMERLGDTTHSFSLTLDKSSLIPYPNWSSNIGLIKLPVVLHYTDKLAPIAISSWESELDQINNGFAVMPGFDLQQSNSLTYGMYRVLSSKECKKEFGNQLDEYLDICVVDWSTNNRNLTYGNDGSGLIQGWPLKSELIGILSARVYNDERSALVFVKLSKYKRWIDETIGNYNYTTASIPANLIPAATV